jgi:hypothetical protein
VLWITLYCMDQPVMYGLDPAKKSRVKDPVKMRGGPVVWTTL